MSKSLQTYRRLLPFLYPYKVKFLFAIGAMCVFGATDGAIPYLLKTVLDDIFGSKNEQMLVYVVIALLVFSLVRGVFGFIEKYLSASIGHFIVRDIRNKIFDKMLTLSPCFFEYHSSGALMSRVTNDALLVRTAITDAASTILRDSIRIIALLSVAIYLDPVLAAIAFIGFPLCVYPVIRFGKKVKQWSRKGQEQFGGITSLLQEVLIGHKVVAIFGREEWERKRFAKENDIFTTAVIKAEKYGALASPTNEVFATLAITAVIVVGALSVIGESRTQGDFIAFITSVFLLYEPFKKLSRVNATLQTGIAAADRIFEVIDTPTEVKDDGIDVLNAPIAAIEFKNVSFSYEKGEVATPILRNVSASVKSGMTVALVGMSGAGKTTFVNLLPRFYDVSEGGIFIHGKDIRTYDLASLRSQISLVGQHVFLFNDSVYNNIAYGKDGVSEAEVVNAAKLSNADGFINELTDGYRSIVGEQGLKLSGGQRARLSIARALLKDAPLLILDEATASLDNDSEDQVQQAIATLMKGRTVFVIAHRLSTIKSADIILVMKAGEIIERGSHDELLARGEEYARLYNIQFKSSLLA